MDSNTIIDFFNGTLPQTARIAIANLSPVISIITRIELFCNNKISQHELLQLQAFIKIAKVYATLDDDIVKHTIDQKNVQDQNPGRNYCSNSFSAWLHLIKSKHKRFF